MTSGSFFGAQAGQPHGKAERCGERGAGPGRWKGGSASSCLGGRRMVLGCGAWDRWRPCPAQPRPRLPTDHNASDVTTCYMRVWDTYSAERVRGDTLVCACPGSAKVLPARATAG